MSIWYKAAGWGTVFAILALVVTLLKQIIAFIGFLTFAIKILVILAFVTLIVGVGLMVIRSWNANRQPKN
jgi:multisubunit Na+/H+ antiporter MnhG subunit